MAFSHFVWHDLMVPDVEAAQAFYGALLGWSFTVDTTGAGPYIRIHDGHGETGGILSLPGMTAAGIPPHWMPYVSVPDVPEAVAKAKALGGGVRHGPMTIEVGTWALVHDDQGAALNLITLDTEPPAPEGEPKPGQFCWYTLQTHDTARGAHFWTRLLDWELQHTELGGGQSQDTFQLGERPMAGLMTIPEGAPQPPAWSVAIAVESVDAAFARAVELQARPYMPPTDLGTMGRMCVIADPQGAVFTLFSR